MDYENLTVQIEDSIATVINSRPDVLNALNSRFFQEMDLVIDDLNANNDVKVVVITGEGKAFAAGADISEMVDLSQAQGKEFSIKGQQTFAKLEQLKQPVIAAVNGFSLGGGCEFAMACDIRIASIKAKFGQPEVNLGLITGFAGSQRLSRLVGLGNALYMLFSADIITAEQALNMGLVQKVVDPDQLIPTAMGLAKKIASKGPQAIMKMKQVVRQGLLTDFEKGCGLEADQFASLFENEGAEGMKAFLEKRKPSW